MIPLGDASRRPRRFPIVTTLIIVANTLVFLMEMADSFLAQSRPEFLNPRSALPTGLG